MKESIEVFMEWIETVLEAMKEESQNHLGDDGFWVCKRPFMELFKYNESKFCGIALQEA